MTTFTIDDWMVAWTPKDWPGDRPERGTIRVGPWPDRHRWSDPYAYTVGCCFTKHHESSLEEKVAQMFIDFHTIVVRDGIDPQEAHREFLQIDEYRRRISPDIKGAEPE